MVESAAIRTLRLVPDSRQPARPPRPPRPRAQLDIWLTMGSLQVISRTLRCSLSTRFPRCTSSCSTASLAPFTARLSGTCVPLAGTTSFAFMATRAAEKNLGRTSPPPTPTYSRHPNSPADKNHSVRSREGRRNRAPPPRVRYNKDGKKVVPTQGAKTTTA